MNDMIIIGAGPAGISASLYTQRAGIDTLVIHNGPGALSKTDKIENYYGFSQPVSGADLFDNGIKQAQRLGVQFAEEEVVGLGFGTPVETDADPGFPGALQVVTDKNTYSAKAIIIATGSPRKAPDIEGLSDFEGAGVSYCAVCDAFFNRGKDVAVLGSGQFALNEVKEIMPVASSVTLLTNGEEPTAGFPEEITINRKPVKRLAGSDRLETVEFEDGSALDVFSVFVAYGTAGSADMAKKLGIITEGNKVQVNDDMATNVPGVFAAGDCIGGMLQVAAAVHEGAKAGTAAVKYLRAQK